MRIHAIQTGTVQIKELQREGRGRGFIRPLNMLMSREWTDLLPILAWVIEHPEGLIVIDTGESSRVSEPGYFPGWHPYYRYGVRFNVRKDDEIGPQMRKKRLKPEDVRWVILTHLHSDHAGGLQYFPKAEILMARAEQVAAQGSFSGFRGYLSHILPSWFSPRLIDFRDAPDAKYTLTKAGDVHLIPTYGHTDGHISVLLQDGGVNYFFAGDVTYTQSQLQRQGMDSITNNVTEYRKTLAKVLDMVRSTPTVYLPSHDPQSIIRLANREVIPGKL